MKTAKKHTKPASGTLKKYKTYKNDGWIHLEVAGTPREIGFTHGKLLRNELKHVLKVLPYNVEQELKIPYAQYLRDCKRIFTPILDSDEWRFIKEELQGIVAGASLKDVPSRTGLSLESYALILMRALLMVPAPVSSIFIGE